MHYSSLVPRPLRMGLFVVAFLALFGLAPAVGAQETAQRDIKVDLDHAKAVIESERKTDASKDELEIAFDNGSHTFEFTYESKEAGEELEANIKVELTDLIEWRDANGNGSYDPDVDGETVQRIGLGDLDPASITREDITEDGVPGVKLTAVSAGLEKYPELVFTLTLYMFGDFLDQGSVALEPTSMKFDIRIVGFPYQAEDTALALAAKAKVDVEGKSRGTAPEATDSIGARVGRYDAFFRWVDHALVDGVEGPIGASFVKHETKSEQKQSGTDEKWETEVVSELYLLYPRGNNIFHDPQIGVGLPRLASESGAGCSYRM